MKKGARVYLDLKTAADGQTHWWRDRAECGSAPPEMVDEAFTRSGGPVARAFAKRFCAVCPVREECLEEAMTTGEHGVWGGAGQHARTKHGAPRPEIRSVL